MGFSALAGGSRRTTSRPPGAPGASPDPGAPERRGSGDRTDRRSSRRRDGPLVPEPQQHHRHARDGATSGARRASRASAAPSLGAAAHGRPRRLPRRVVEASGGGHDKPASSARRKWSATVVCGMSRAAPTWRRDSPWPQANRRMARTLRMAGRSLGTATSSQRTPRDGDRPPQLTRGPLRHPSSHRSRGGSGRRHCVPGSPIGRAPACGYLATLS